MANRTKKPSCDGSTSQSCGMGCISREDTCREQISADVASRLISVATQYKQANDLKSKLKLPLGVEVSRGGDMTTYSYKFSVNDSLDVELEVSEGFSGGFGDEIIFSVNGQYLDGAAFTKRQGAKIAITLASIFRYDVSTKLDGHKYYTSATTDDGNGYKRAAAYERLGFSRPKNGKAGSNQYGLVKDGKLVPNLAYLEQTDTDEPQTIARRMLENKQLRLKAKRK